MQGEEVKGGEVGFVWWAILYCRLKFVQTSNNFRTIFHRPTFVIIFLAKESLLFKYIFVNNKQF